MIALTPQTASSITVASASAKKINLEGHSTFSAYTGSYEFTPTAETQTIVIKSLYATDDITINPIPSNYGLITWDGSVLTVS